MKRYWGSAALAVALGIGACDAVRIPGREHPNDAKPDAAPTPSPQEDPGDQAPGDASDDAQGGDEAPEPFPMPAPDETEPDPTPVEDTDPAPAPPPSEPEPEPEPAPPPAPTFSYFAPGALLAGSGTGAPDRTVFAPDMVFPIKSAPAYPQSQVWNFGGGIGGGDECDARNYSYPWRDNFCETRSSNFNTTYCPVSRVHLGQDIRVGTPQGCEQLRRTPAAERKLYEVVAAEDGLISNIGRYTVNVRAGSRIYRYLHLNMQALEVELGDMVSAGQTIGYVSKDFGGTPTTFHLHFEIKQVTADGGWEFVPPYSSLVTSYERREGGPGEEVEQSVAVASTPRPIPDGVSITEGFVSPETAAQP